MITYRKYNRLKKTIIAFSLLGIAILALYLGHRANYTSADAIYKGNAIYETEDGNAWEFDTSTELPKGSKVVINFYNKPYADTALAEIVSIELR